MNAFNSTSGLHESQSCNWQDLYQATLRETDGSVLIERIAKAEKSLLLKERELFNDPKGAAERKAVQRALYGLQALRISAQLKLGSHRRTAG